MACEVIHLLSEYYLELCVFDKDLPLKIVEVCKMELTTLVTFHVKICVSVNYSAIIFQKTPFCPAAGASMEP